MGSWTGWIAAIASALAIAGIGWVLAAAIVAARFGRLLRAPSASVAPEAATILKPLYGAEPKLGDNLRSFCDQRWSAPVQIVAGVQSGDDGALAALHPFGAAIDTVIDPRIHGANAKIGNLINMTPAIRHDLIVLSDSDIAAPTDYLTRVAATLAEPGVGAATCAYAGRGDCGIWSVLGAAGISYHFLPSVLLSVALRTGDVCMGSTIAMRRDTLERIGGFDRFADILADDHAIGAAVRELGLSVAIAPVIVTHASAERSFAELARHELRWAATVRDLNPAGYVGLVLTHPLPFALIAAGFAPGWPSVALVATAVAVRIASARAIDKMVGRTTAPRWLLPLRDLLSFAIFVASFFVRQVRWRDTELAMRKAGRIEIKRA
ncbi:MAG: bacteriohopanetetrol glucosamine biosynthesis glycosyltransferase HpnI [Sphingomonas sp.]|nr:bacteriohopanetetrol glucosamine biosynthesis glycosyltransferase HpnI [Sphingomonas sp.]